MPWLTLVLARKPRALVVAGTPETGTISLYVCRQHAGAGGGLHQHGQLHRYRMAAAINTNGDLPVTASSSSATVTVTSRHKGRWATT